MDRQQIDISGLLEITPELEKDILWTLRVASILKDHLKKGVFYKISVDSAGAIMTIFDRDEGELGFYSHDFDSYGGYNLCFTNSKHTPEADLYEKAFLKKYKPEMYKLFYKDE